MPKKLTTESFIKKVKERHGDKYDLSLVKYTKYNEKVSVICLKHGKFECIADYLIQNRECCPKCVSRNIEVFLKSAKKRFSKGLSKFISEAKSIHGDKYDYSLAVYKNNKTKVKIICPAHGEFEQVPVSHINKKIGCKKCSHENLSKKLSLGLDAFQEKAKSTFGDIYDYSNVKYTNNSSNVSIICKKHGEFKKTPANHIDKRQGCPMCNDFNSSSAQKEIHNFVAKFFNDAHSDNKILNGQELDVFVPKLNIAIEYNGVYWHSDLQGKDKNYHLNKTRLCQQKGIRLIHIFENEFINKEKIVKARLKNILNSNKYKIAARKCFVKQISSKIKNKFLEKYHIQGSDRSSSNLGLFYKGRVVAVMTFCKNRKALGKLHINGEWELSRFATISNFSIVGGAGKLLKYFERTYKPTKITSYADKRWSEGNLYEKLGFNKARESKPNYWYFKKREKLYHRFNFRKSELPKKLQTFDPNKTEWENMRENGWNRIWDCGNLVFEKTYI